MMIKMNCFVVRLTEERRLALFPAGTIVRDPHHLESLTRREKNRSSNYSVFHQLLGWTAFLEISNDF